MLRRGGGITGRGGLCIGKGKSGIETTDDKVEGLESVDGVGGMEEDMPP